MTDKRLCGKVEKLQQRSEKEPGAYEVKMHATIFFIHRVIPSSFGILRLNFAKRFA